jgi:ABC-2 type transport system permease protein
MLPVFWLSFRQFTGPARLALILFLAALPVALAVIVVLVSGDDGIGQDDYINVLLDGLLVAGILPIVTMTLSTAAFGNDLEDGTLSNLVLMPIPRWRIALPKLLAAVAICGPLIVISGAVSALVGLSVELQPALAVAVALILGVSAYAAIFTWAGLVTGRALAFALLYVLLWEGIIGSFIDGVNYLSVRGYTLAIMYGLDKSAFESIGDRVIELPVALVGAVLVTGLFFGLSVRRLTRMDVS